MITEESLVDAWNVNIVVTEHVGNHLAEEVGQVHGDHDEDKEVVKETDEAKQSLGQQIQGREEVGNPDQAQDCHSQLECKVQSLPWPYVTPKMSE